MTDREELARRVSVVVPTRARAGLLDRALRSVADQHHRPAELLIVHDEPLPDDDAPHATALPPGLEDVLVRRVTTGGAAGASAARNLGAELATGTHVAFLDDDDVWHPSFLARCLDAMATADVDWSIAWMRDVDSGRWRPGRTMPPGATAADTLSSNVGMTGSNFVIRRQLFLDQGGFDETLPVWNDLDLLVRLLEAGTPYAVVTERLVDQHFGHGPTLTSAASRPAQMGPYLAKWDTKLTPADHRVVQAEMFEAARHHEPSRVGRFVLFAKQLRCLGPRRSWRRLAARLSWRRIPMP